MKISSKAARSTACVGLAFLLLITFSASACARRVRAGGEKAAPGGAPSVPAALPTTLAIWDTARVQAEIKARRGRPFLVHMWASWCAPCLHELPLIESFAQKARARGVEVVSIALDTEVIGGAQVPATLHDRAPHLSPIIAHFNDPAPFIALFSNEWQGSIPALFAFGADGTLSRAFYSMVSASDLDGVLERLAPRSLSNHL